MLGFQRGFVDIRGRSRKNANSGDGTEMFPGLKKCSDRSETFRSALLWGGDHESGVRMAELDFVDEIYSRTPVYVLTADSRKKRQEKISGILGTNSSLGPAVNEGVINSWIPRSWGAHACLTSGARSDQHT